MDYVDPLQATHADYSLFTRWGGRNSGSGQLVSTRLSCLPATAACAQWHSVSYSGLRNERTANVKHGGFEVLVASLCAFVPVIPSTNVLSIHTMADAAVRHRAEGGTLSYGNKPEGDTHQQLKKQRALTIFYHS